MQIAVNLLATDALFLEAFGDTMGGDLGVGEDDHQRGHLLLEKAKQRGELVFTRDRHKTVFNVFDGEFVTGDV